MTPARKALATAFLFFALGGGAVLLYLGVTGARSEPVAATLLPTPRPLPSFSLVDQNGDPFTKDSLAGQQSVLFFGFTNCPDVCPATLQQLAVAKRRLAADGFGFPDIVLVSVDPDRDTPDVLARYVDHFGADIVGVTGSAEEISRFASALGIYVSKSEVRGDNYNVDHSAAVLLIDTDAAWHAVFSAPHTIDGFVHDIPLLTGLQ
jgi:protein SCO1/2